MTEAIGANSKLISEQVNLLKLNETPAYINMRE